MTCPALTGSQPERIGPYEIVSVLGRGATGVVYLAQPSAGGDAVALKTLRVPESGALMAIRREIHALRRIEHPGVVRILAEGMEAGIPWFATARIDATTLRDRLEEQGRFSAAEAIGLAKRLASALAFVHGEGIVHGDLKPENVVLRGGVPVLIDFGFAARVPGQRARETLDDRPAWTGTPAYMAPEQVRGEPVDGRTDLYALGCVLYELLTGRPPFSDADPARVLLRHRDEEPVPPADRVDGIPPALDALVVSLLAKDPRRRVGFAEDVAHALEALSGAAAESARPTSSILYRPSLLGRADVLDGLLAAVRDAQDSRGSFVLLEGEAGVGKTYLAAELSRRRGAMQSILGRAAPGTGERRHAPTAPLEPLRVLMRAAADLCVTQPEAAATSALRAAAAPLAAFEPAVSALATGSDPARAPADREEVLAALRALLDAIARDRPVLLVIDDLHWADELSIAFLTSIARGWLSQRPILVLATVRIGEGGKALDELRTAVGAARTTIEGLDEVSVAALVGELMALDEIPSGVGAFLTRQSQGNPFYVAEYLRAGIAEGLIGRATAGRLTVGRDAAEATPQALASLSLPAELRDLVLRRLDRLSEPARALVEIGAVAGRTFEAPLLQRVAGLRDTAFLSAFDELVRRDVVEAMEGESFRFVHDRLAEIAYERADAGRRRRLHRAVAEALEGDAPDAVPAEKAAALAHHWRAVGDPGRELRYAPPAGLHALAVHAHGDAAAALERSLELEVVCVAAGREPTPVVERAHWHQALATVEFRRGDQVRAEEEARLALDLLGYALPRGEWGWNALLGRELCRQLARPAFARLHRAPPHGEEDRIGAQAALLLSHRYFFLDEMIAMLGIAFLAGNLAERCGHPEDVPSARVSMGTVASLLGLRSLGERLIAEGCEAALQGRDPLASALAFTSESVYHATLGDWEAADRAARRAVDFAARQGDPHVRVLSLVTLGHVEHFSGHVAEALARYQEVLRRANERENPQLITWARFTIGRGLVALGRDREALEHLDAAWARLEQRPEPQSEVICAGLQALARHRIGEVERAVEHADAALARIRGGRPTAFVALEGYEGMMRVYLAEAGRNAHARAALRQGLRAWRRLALLMPVARAACLRHRAAVARLDGRESRAAALLRRAAQQAERCAPAAEAARIRAMAGTNDARSPAAS